VDGSKDGPLDMKISCSFTYSLSSRGQWPFGTCVRLGRGGVCNLSKKAPYEMSHGDRTSVDIFGRRESGRHKEDKNCLQNFGRKA
jgi:hypothetical protein